MRQDRAALLAQIGALGRMSQDAANEFEELADNTEDPRLAYGLAELAGYIQTLTALVKKVVTDA